MPGLSFQRSVAVTIKMSLLVAVVFLLATLASVSLLAKWRLAALEQSVEQLGRDRLPRMRAMGEAELAVTRMRLSAVRAALATTDAERTQIKDLIAERMTALDNKLDALRQLVADDPAQSLILESFTSKWRTYLKYQDEILGTEARGSRDQIGQLVNAVTLGPFQDVIDAIDEGINYADIQANEVIRGAEQERGRFATLLWLLNGASVFVGLGTLIFVIRDVSLPIRRITESMERIAEGELDAEIPFAERRNELGMMARALVVFRKSLAENERLGAATRTLSELSDWLQLAKSEAELYDMIADVLARLMPECAGTLFIYTAERDFLARVKAWNDPRDVVSMHPDDCWALRRGHTYVHGMSEIEFPCAHVDAAEEDYCCIPILAHGETVGLLYLQYLRGESESAADAKARITDRQRLGLAAAEHISIAIANAKLREKLRDQSMRDVLTGLNNRRYLMEAGQRELKRAARENLEIGALAIDIDHFKSFNDTHGHGAGDAVLREVGAVIGSFAREYDIACRNGGEEFVVLMPRIDASGAAARAEELRGRVEATSVRHGGVALPRVTISVGVAIYPDAGADLAALLKSADEALYAAKRHGRNRVEIARDNVGSRLASADEGLDRLIGTISARQAAQDSCCEAAVTAEAARDAA